MGIEQVLVNGTKWVIHVFSICPANSRESGANPRPNAVWGRLSLLNSLVYARHRRELMG